MRVVKLTIDENSELEGIDAVALVENPAIELDWQMFSEQKFETYNDYPEGAVEAAKMGIKRNEEIGNKCATQVGKVRAQQLANRENVSIDTIKRMRSFLIRQKDNYDLAIKNKDYEACGYISYLLWGGPDALPWAEKKLKQAGLLEASTEEIIKQELGKDDKYFDNLSDEKKTQLLKALDNVGTTEESLANDGWVEMSEDAFHNHLYFAIVSEPEKGSLQDTPNYRVLYKYEGPRDSKNRTFCREVLNKNLLFRVEDINNMSLQGENSEFSTYDIFAYKGSYNCRHTWVQKFYRKEKPLDDQKRSSTTNKTYKDVIGGPRVQEAAQKNPKSRTVAQVAEGVPEGQFEFSKYVKEQQLLAGPLMVADKLIPRIDANGEKYYVFFPAEEIKKLSYKLMQKKLVDSINIEHDSNRKVSDITLVETWLVEDPKRDKSLLFGNELPKGSWFGIYKCNNKEVWNDYVKTGKVKGFSVEGIFSDKVILEASK